MATFNGSNANRRAVNNGSDCADSGYGSMFVSLATLIIIVIVLIIMVVHIIYNHFSIDQPGKNGETKKMILNILQYTGIGFLVVGSLLATYNYVVVSRMKACIQ